MNDENLIPFSERSESEVRALASKGGKKSGETRRKKKKIRDAMALVMSLGIVNDDEMKAYMEASGLEDEEQNQSTAIAISMALQARAGSVAAAQYCAEMNGEGLKQAELKEKIRHHKAEEAAKQRELDIREKELSIKMGEGVQKEDNQKFSDIITQIADRKSDLLEYENKGE